ncbi:AAA+ ATPase domain-containing protein [Pseudoscourfieldia marina]
MLHAHRLSHVACAQPAPRVQLSVSRRRLAVVVPRASSASKYLETDRSRNLTPKEALKERESLANLTPEEIAGQIDIFKVPKEHTEKYVRKRRLQKKGDGAHEPDPLALPQGTLEEHEFTVPPGTKPESAALRNLIGNTPLSWLDPRPRLPHEYQHRLTKDELIPLPCGTTRAFDPEKVQPHDHNVWPFTEADRQRVAKHGPRLSDVVVHMHKSKVGSEEFRQCLVASDPVDFADMERADYLPTDQERINREVREKESKKVLDEEGDDQKTFDERIINPYIPLDVIGGLLDDPAPDWEAMPQMNYGQLYQGIRKRSWTSNFFDPESHPWKLDFYSYYGSPDKVLGIFPKVGWNGWRVVVTDTVTAEQSWVALHTPGAHTFLDDYLKGLGTSVPGNVGRVRRPETKGYPSDYGYEQVFEELARAQEPYATPQQRELFKERRRQPETVLTTVKSNFNAHSFNALTGHAHLDPMRDEERLPLSPTEALNLLDVDYHVTPAREGIAMWKHKKTAQYAIFTFGGTIFVLGALFAGIRAVGMKVELPRDEEEAEVYARSKGNARVNGETGVRLTDIGGIETQKQELLKVIDFLVDPDRYDALGARPPKGVLLEGPPGTGKTMLAKAIAGESGVPFFEMGGSEFVEVLVGVGAARVRDLFNRARLNAPCVVFIDEVDSIALKRGTETNNAEEEREQALNQLLTELDGFTPDQGVIFIAATNRASALDPAMLRPGRFDLQIKIGKPETIAERVAILNIHSRDVNIADDVNMLQIARDLPGLSAAQLANMVREAKFACIARGDTIVNKKDFEEAMDRVLLGIRSPPLSEDLPMKRGFAVYEASRALLSTLVYRKTRNLERIERMSITARNGTYSRTQFERMDPRYYTYKTRAQVLERICMLLAGRVGEYVYFGECTTMSTVDLSDAQNLIRRFLTTYGLSRRFGISYQLQQYEKGVRSEGEKAQKFSGQVESLDDQPMEWEAKKMEKPKEYWGPVSTNRGLVDWQNHVRVVHEWAYLRMSVMLLTNRRALDNIVEALLEKEELTGEEVEALIDAAEPLTPEEVKDQLENVCEKHFLDKFLEWNYNMSKRVEMCGGNPPF